MAEDDDVRMLKVSYYSRGRWSSSPPSDLTYDVTHICMDSGDFSCGDTVAVTDSSIEIDRLIKEALYDNFAKRLQKEKEAAFNEARRKEGAPVKMGRPSDYNPSLTSTLGPSRWSPGSAGGLKGPDRVFVGGLPYYFTEAQIRELLETFGPLRGFDLVKDRETGNSKGYAFCVYHDLSVTDIACAALNGIKMEDKTLTVRRANQGTIQPKPEQESALLHAQQQIALQGQAQMREEREELDKMLEEYRRRVEEVQRREALERKEEERYREIELIKRQKEESAWRMKLEELEERAKQLKVSGKSQPRSNSSFGMGL